MTCTAISLQYTSSFSPHSGGTITQPHIIHTPIAFDERVTFVHQHEWPQACACTFIALFTHTLANKSYPSIRANSATNAYAQGSARRVEAQKSLSPQRQPEYDYIAYQFTAQFLAKCYAILFLFAYKIISKLYKDSSMSVLLYK